MTPLQEILINQWLNKSKPKTNRKSKPFNALEWLLYSLCFFLIMSTVYGCLYLYFYG